VSGAGKDLLDRLPKAERAVADGEIRRDLKAAPPDVDEEFAPALRALPNPGLEADEFLFAFGRALPPSRANGSPNFPKCAKRFPK
jgi:hypothetical protein